jgi:hypothetical protein
MKRRLIVICMMAVIALGAYVAYAYVQGAAPFEKPQKATSDLAVTAASTTGTSSTIAVPRIARSAPICRAASAQWVRVRPVRARRMVRARTPAIASAPRARA